MHPVESVTFNVLHNMPGTRRVSGFFIYPEGHFHTMNISLSAAICETMYVYPNYSQSKRSWTIHKSLCLMNIHHNHLFLTYTVQRFIILKIKAL